MKLSSVLRIGALIGAGTLAVSTAYFAQVDRAQPQAGGAQTAPEGGGGAKTLEEVTNPKGNVDVNQATNPAAVKDLEKVMKPSVVKTPDQLANPGAVKDVDEVTKDATQDVDEVTE